MSWPLQPAHQPIRILLVEDDDGEAKAVQRAFLKARIANPIVRALDGIEALEILRGSERRPRLEKPYMLLIDLNMPRMGGIPLATAIREDPELRDAIIFILTTSNRVEDKEAAHLLNVAGFILKENVAEDFLQLFNLVDCYWRIVEMP
ncbi:MAG: response regulator [Terracidiphilus sp.]|jgi:CheY-like chemotaxis protein|nr:response regulator [Terracidiphilus sp.]